MAAQKQFLGTVASFTQAYPSIQSLHATVRHEGEVPQTWQQVQEFTEHSIPKEIRCLNPKCQQGGFDLGAILITLEHEQKTKYDVTLNCRGHEGTPKGRKRGDSCFNSVAVELELTFKA